MQVVRDAVPFLLLHSEQFLGHLRQRVFGTSLGSDVFHDGQAQGFSVGHELRRRHQANHKTSISDTVPALDIAHHALCLQLAVASMKVLGILKQIEFERRAADGILATNPGQADPEQV